MSDTQRDPVDALDAIEAQDREIRPLLDKWRSDTRTLTEEGDDVDVRWERGSAVKLLLQHLAVREAAKADVVARLRADGHDDLADRVEGNGVQRREAIRRLDEEVRGRVAMNLNHTDVDHAVMAVGEIFDDEAGDDADVVAAAASAIGGEPGDRGLPSVKSVQARSRTHPDTEEGALTKLKPLQAVRALYEHLRGTPTGGTSPGVDGSREHLPGPT